MSQAGACVDAPSQRKMLISNKKERQMANYDPNDPRRTDATDPHRPAAPETYPTFPK